MEINVNGVQVQFYLDTGAEVNIINKETFDYIGVLSLQKCDEVASMYNGQTATFLGKGRAVFRRLNHTIEDVFYVEPRGSLNLLSYPTMQRLGLYIADAEAVNAFSTEHPSTSSIKADTVASLKKLLPRRLQGRTWAVHSDEGDTLPQVKRNTSLPSRQASALRLSTDCGARA
jgi:hypothetical protein